MEIKPIDSGKWERKLNIITGAGDYEKEDAKHSRYEPTSYAILDRLAKSGYLQKQDVLVDYGCGKGRVDFFLNYALGCETIGVEYNEALWVEAEKNLKNYLGKNKNKISFILESAENYDPIKGNRFYFFNPFSVEILQTVLRRIYESYYSRPRRIYLFFYYALDDYLTYLMMEDALDYIGEIDCGDIFYNENIRERIVIFGLGEME